MVPTAKFYRQRLTAVLARGLRDADEAVTTPQNEDELLAVPRDAEFVRQAYRFFLKRDPDITGLQYFCELAGTIGREAVISGIANSDEARQLGLSRRARGRE